MKKLGFIGMGNMAGAMAKGFLAAGVFDKDHLFACARDWNKLCGNAETIGFTPMHTAEELIDAVDIVLLAIKPYQMEAVLPPLAEKLKQKLVLSVVAGWDDPKLNAILAEGTHHLYVMPNTPVAVCEGVMMLEEANTLSAEELAEVKAMLEPLGTVEVLASHLMNPGMAIAGCGPAFMAMVIEALGDAGVKYGLQRATAYKLAAQTMTGTGKLHLTTGTHPGVMKDAVCSPAGTTIKGVTQLEKAGLRAAMIEAIEAVLR